MASLLNADVVIIGGGPAGSSAAITAAQYGLSVILVESRMFLRGDGRRSVVHHRPGETLHPGVTPLLKQLGIWAELPHADLLRHPGHWLETDMEERFEAFGADPQGPWSGVQIPRAILDTALLRQARKLGVHVLQPCQCYRLTIKEQQITGVTTNQGNIACQYVIDAAGGSHWLSRTYQLRLQHYSSPLTAVYGYLKGECPYLEQPRFKVDAQGWTWMAQVQPQLYQWTRLNLNHVSGDCPSQILNASELCDLQAYGKVRKENVTWRKLDKPAGRGYFSAGDASFILDPGASHGVLKAIMSGIMASHAISQILSGKLSETLATHAFCQWIDHWFYQDVRSLTSLYRQWGWKTDVGKTAKVS